MQKVDTFTVQNKKTWFDANSRRQLTKLTHPSYLKQNAITTQKLVVSKFTRLRKKEKVKASSKWLGLSLILTIKNRNLQNCKLQLCFLSLSSAKASFQSSLTSVQTLSLSGCLIHLGSHPSKPDWILHLFKSLLSEPFFLLTTPPDGPLLSDSQLLNPAPSSAINRLTDILSQEGTIRNRNKFFKTAKLHFKTLMINSRFPSQITVAKLKTLSFNTGTYLNWYSLAIVCVCTPHYIFRWIATY